MSKSRKKIDNRLYPQQTSFVFKDRVEQCLNETSAIMKEIKEVKNVRNNENWCEAAMDLASAIKKAINESGMTREQVVDRINRYFGWPSTDDVERMRDRAEKSGNKITNSSNLTYVVLQKGEKTDSFKHLSYAMFNHFLSKPTEYPIHGFMLYAINHVTGSLAICRDFAEAEGGKAMTRAEKDKFMFSRLRDTKWELDGLFDDMESGRLRF